MCVSRNQHSHADDVGLLISFPLSPRILPAPQNDITVGDGIGDVPFPPLVMEVGIWEHASGALEPMGGSRNTKLMLVLPFLDSSCIEDETFTS